MYHVGKKMWLFLGMEVGYAAHLEGDFTTKTRPLLPFFKIIFIFIFIFYYVVKQSTGNTLTLLFEAMWDYSVDMFYYLYNFLKLNCNPDMEKCYVLPHLCRLRL
jgi:hypothetical protein